jgi:hypothetical protein
MNESLQNATRCPATIDWAVASQVVAEGWIFVTNDKGTAFEQLDRKRSLGALEGIVKKRVSAK